MGNCLNTKSSPNNSTNDISLERAANDQVADRPKIYAQGHIEVQPVASWSGSFVSQTPNRNVIAINGQLQYDKNKRISQNVFEGLLSNRKVAVKFDQATKIDREIKILSTLDHPNILRLILGYSMSDGQSVLISEFYERENHKLKIEFKSIMSQLMSALEHLQRKKILHLDVSPENIFIAKRDHEYVAKLTNFDKAQKITQEFIFVQTFNSNVEYCAPELLKNEACMSSDVFSLGKVFINLLLKNGHGKVQNGKGKKNQRKNEIRSTLDVSRLKNDSYDLILAKNLCENMMIENPSKRIAPENALKHPFFWSASQTLNFIVEIAKMLEGKDNNFRTEIYKGCQRVMGGRDAEWTSRIGKKLLDELRDARKAYCARTGANNDDINGKSFSSLITTIRNMIVHTKSDEVTAIVGKDDEAFVKFWTSRFPNLILHLHEAKLKYEKEN